MQRTIRRIKFATTRILIVRNRRGNFDHIDSYFRYITFPFHASQLIIVFFYFLRMLSPVKRTIGSDNQNKVRRIRLVKLRCNLYEIRVIKRIFKFRWKFEQRVSIMKSVCPLGRKVLSQKSTSLQCTETSICRRIYSSLFLRKSVSVKGIETTPNLIRNEDQTNKVRLRRIFFPFFPL